MNKKIQELIEKRAKAWEGAKAFVESKKDSDGLLSKEDVETYNMMEEKVKNFTFEIERLQEMENMERELSKPVNDPLISKPMVSDKEDKIQKTKEEQIRQNLKQSNVNLNEHAQKALDILGEKEQIDKQITEKQSELNEFKSPKEKREFVKAKLDTLDKNDDLKDSLEILKEKEIKNTKELKSENSKQSNDNEKEKGKENKEELEKKQDQNNLAVEQDDWDKRAKELELQHEKELEALKDQQSRLEANFQKSIDNLINSDGINGVLTALQEMDRSLEMMLKQGKEDSEKKEKQRQEKLELAFDSPKFKEAVGDLVKEVFNEHKKVKGGLDELEKEHKNYAKIQTTYEKETKKGIDIKGYEKLKKLMDDINKETPNFKEHYPKFYKKVDESLKQSKDKILNKNQENQNDKSRSL